MESDRPLVWLSLPVRLSDILDCFAWQGRTDTPATPATPVTPVSRTLPLRCGLLGARPARSAPPRLA